MLPLPLVPTPDQVSARVLNALLRRETWAADRLAGHAGKTLQFTVGALRLRYTIDMAGFLQPTDAAVVADVSLSIPAQSLPELPGAFRTRDIPAITRLLHVEGDAALASLVSELARDLRWDVEHELAMLFGDAMAMRILHGLRLMTGFTRSATERISGNLAEYLGEEARLLLSTPAHEGFCGDLASLMRRIDALDRRLANAERGGL